MDKLSTKRGFVFFVHNQLSFKYVLNDLISHDVSRTISTRYGRLLHVLRRCAVYIMSQVEHVLEKQI